MNEIETLSDLKADEITTDIIDGEIRREYEQRFLGSTGINGKNFAIAKSAIDGYWSLYVTEDREKYRRIAVFGDKENAIELHGYHSDALFKAFGRAFYEKALTNWVEKQKRLSQDYYCERDDAEAKGAYLAYKSVLEKIDDGFTDEECDEMWSLGGEDEI